MSRAVHITREIDGWIRRGDEEINHEIEETALQTKQVEIPSKLKAVIRFGYDELGLGWAIEHLTIGLKKYLFTLKLISNTLVLEQKLFLRYHLLFLFISSISPY